MNKNAFKHAREMAGYTDLSRFTSDEIERLKKLCEPKLFSEFKRVIEQELYSQDTSCTEVK